MEQKNISHIKDCYGCGVCAAVCPKKIIRIDLNKDGFYEPDLFNEAACTQCGLCLSVCAYNDHSLLDATAKEVKAYAAWSNDEQVRLKCSSGGIGFELGKFLINQGYKACGVKYNPDLNRAEHFMAETTAAFMPAVGSKYIQSYTLSGFSQFKKGDKYFVTGTPCQVDSLRRYIRKMKIEENFVLMDFFCHGVPTMNMWKKYSEMIEQKTGKITAASWRNKRNGWHDSWAMQFEGSTEEIKTDLTHANERSLRGKNKADYFSLMTKGDLFYKFFLGNSCLGKACYAKCKYKYDKSAADIRIGDLWGSKYIQDKDGVSAVLAFTDRGKDIIVQMKSCTFKKEELAIAAEGQMIFPPEEPKLRKYLMKLFTSDRSIKQVYKFYSYYLFPARVINKSLRILHLK